MPQDGEISGWPSALRAFLLLYSYLLFYYLFIRTYLLPASSSSPWATRTWGGGGGVRDSPLQHRRSCSYGLDAVHTVLETAKASGCIGSLHRRPHRRCTRIHMFVICFLMLFSCPVGRGRHRCEPCAPGQGGSHAGLTARGRESLEEGGSPEARTAPAPPALRKGLEGGHGLADFAPRPSADGSPVGPGPGGGRPG